jgi:DNA polymerase-3 subunit beta
MVLASNGDLEAGSRGLLETCEAEGRICVDASKLSALLRSFDADKLIGAELDGETLKLKCGRSRFKLTTLAASDFPNVEVPKEGWKVKNLALGANFQDQVGRVCHAMAMNDPRYMLNGLLVEVAGSEIRLVATDGHRLATSHLTVDAQGDASCIIPSKMVKELGRCFGKGATLAMSISDTHFEVRSNEGRLTSKVIEGKFPDYQKVIPKSCPKSTTICREVLLAAMKRSLITSQDQTRGVKLSFDKGLVIESHNQTSETSVEEMDVAWQHGSFEVGFNGQYLQDALNAVKGDDCLLEFADGNGALMLSSMAETEVVRVVLMPCRLV